MQHAKVIIVFLLSISHANFALAINPLGCLIEPEQVAEVGSQVIGVTESVLVERGDFVKKGQVLATLRSDVERASVEVAKTRSQLEADVNTAEANFRLAQVTEKRGEALVEKKFISQQALDKSHAETAVAEHKLAFTREQLKLASGDLAVARAQLGLRAIRSPIDGIISDRYIWPGERVEEKPLFRVVKVNPLRVEIVAPVALFGTIDKNSLITITPDLPNLQPIIAKVILVDKLIDGASNTFRIRAEIPNPKFDIPSGLRCKATLPESSEKTAINLNVGRFNTSTSAQRMKISTRINSMVGTPTAAIPKVILVDAVSHVTVSSGNQLATHLILDTKLSSLALSNATSSQKIPNKQSKPAAARDYY
jgi:membrane fusion protein, heavy metal efflux system